MSVKIMAQVWECSQCQSEELLLLLALADFADDEGIAFPKLDVLCHKARIKTKLRQIQRYLQAIIRKGELMIKHGQGPGGVNLYQVICHQRSLFTASTAKDRGVIHDGGGVIHDGVSLMTPSQPVGREAARQAQSLGGVIHDGVSRIPLPASSPLKLPSSPSSPTGQKKDPPAMPPKVGGRVCSEAYWTEFQQSYPHRLGKALDRSTTKKRFAGLSLNDQALLASAARNYAKALALQGLKAKDATRFLRTRSGYEPWRDWIDPAPGTVPRCTWTVDLQGKRCEAIVDTQQTTTSYKLCRKHLTIRLDLDRKIAETGRG